MPLQEARPSSRASEAVMTEATTSVAAEDEVLPVEATEDEEVVVDAVDDPSASTGGLPLALPTRTSRSTRLGEAMRASES